MTGQVHYDHVICGAIGQEFLYRYAYFLSRRVQYLSWRKSADFFGAEDLCQVDRITNGRLQLSKLTISIARCGYKQRVS